MSRHEQKCNDFFNNEPHIDYHFYAKQPLLGLENLTIAAKYLGRLGNNPAAQT